ncbi:3'(2'),5'-bisphosphate nucleotidase CysQ [Alicyclobacillus cycloheptanicus]|uniref:inositol-phosphate phosphatase n=1 Tax=Alicyclobacillus cycloheptanicus TaxID=1457 RepID=A0ABT9XME0_9BACL|nr:3'(2'),5'-bisphosphate nucleotidase CysQ [Alicyclobacillus cycloheptanicus]MDQ0191194.1 myo-inositol-1(or 4)-monophosphatase [Alicyclobacillus cycloheptanicus]WDM02109.1 3'(2'),5'-bisphosphate nucleotidase CysQ [Alicyclobacillus cycloheptanicus]
MDKHFLDAVVEVTRRAGEMVETIAAEGFETNYKGHNDPVTTADHAANDYLKEHLCALLPEAGWLSEETRDSEDRLDKAYVWIVDPIDGTKEFVQRVPQYAVSVALAHHGDVVLGVVYNPARDECFHALKGVGAWLNDQPMAAVAPKREPLLILGSRSEIKRGEFVQFEGLADVEAVGSIAYKLALIAAGRANTTFSLGPKNEWDIAAGVALVEAAGGRATDKAGQPLVFNQRNTLTNGILATAKGDFDRVLAMIQSRQG